MYLYLIRAIGRRLPSWYLVPHVFLLSGYYYSFCHPFCTRLSGSYWLFYELIVLMCIFYSSNKVPPGAFGIGLGESVMVIAWWPLCTRNTGIPSVRAFRAQIRPCKHRGVSITGRKSNSWQCVANCGCPGRDVILNVREMAYAVIRSCIRHDPEV